MNEPHMIVRKVMNKAYMIDNLMNLQTTCEQDSTSSICSHESII